MDYVQNTNVSMINEHKRVISEKKNLKITKINKMHCWRQILTNMFKSMAVSWFIHVKTPYHIRICGQFGTRSSVEITIK